MRVQRPDSKGERGQSGQSNAEKARATQTWRKVKAVTNQMGRGGGGVRQGLG